MISSSVAVNFFFLQLVLLLCLTNLDDGANLYLAPEVVNNQPYNEKVDIFSFGVILRLLLTGVVVAATEEEEEEEEEYLSATDRPSDNSKHSDIEPRQPVATTIPMQLLIGT